ncbi:hypothetical protein JW766_05990 [Candidatus Dojkabacteria bacterium]|nr:hypothetical protein [Candidatus Dojkabacteria bacterium]
MIITRKDRFLDQTLAPLASLKISADIISFAGLASGILAAFYLTQSLSLFFIFWLGKRIADILDGPIARLNKIKIFTKLDVDRFCDVTFSILIFLAPTPESGIWLPAITALAHFTHVIFDEPKMGSSLFAPCNFAQFFFLFGLFKEGLTFQLLYTVVAFIYMRIRTWKR